MPNKPSDYLGLLVSINNTAPFIDEKFSDELGVVVAHEGPRVEQVEHPSCVGRGLLQQLQSFIPCHDDGW